MSDRSKVGLLIPPTIVTSNLRPETPDEQHARSLSGSSNAPSLLVPSSPTNASLDGETLRSRANSFVSRVETTRSRGYSDAGTLQSRFEGDDLTAEEALQPDPLNQNDFVVEDNPFAFSPGHMNKLLNPKSLAAYKALGGIKGLEKGLRTNVVAGLSLDESKLVGKVSFEEATSPSKKAAAAGSRIISPEDDGQSSDQSIINQYQDRHRVFSENRLPVKKPATIWRLFWNAYNDHILWLLTGAAVISLALGIYEAVGGERQPGQPQSVDWVEGVAIIVAIVIVVLVTGLNDYRRDKQFAKLNARKEDRLVKGVRSGRTIQMSIYDITAGDILHLESGDAVPADGVLISGHGLVCDESSATGESHAMRKMAGSDVWTNIEEGKATDKMDPFIVSGAKVLEGLGTYLVTSVGVNSSYGKILMSLQNDVEETPLQVKLGKLADWIGYIGTAAASLLFAVLLIRFLVTLSGNTNSPAQKGSQFLDILIVAVTIIVVAVPEGLPLSVTLALSFATKRMYEENNLVRHLRACETMGNATTICSDKTGTLTQNKMTVVAGLLNTDFRFAQPSNAQNLGNETMPIQAAFSRLSNPIRDLLLQSIAINSTAFEGQEDNKNTFIGSKTETALLVLAQEQMGMGPLAEERAGVEIVTLFPFDSNRKCMGVIIRLATGSYRLLVKGAAEILLEKATKRITDPSSTNIKIEAIDADSRLTLSTSITSYAKQSLRTIGLLYRDFQSWPPLNLKSLEDGKQAIVLDDLLEELTFIGIVGLQDPLREGVARAVEQCQMAGINVRMVTGDNVDTAISIATECGIMTSGGLVLEGPQFRRLPYDELDRILPNLQVLARSSPEDKRILVTRLKFLGETVAVTGDGTNDAPALKAADIGFSMGIAGTEVAKEASSIILMDDNFRSIVKAVMWGRSVNDAVAKFLQFQVTVNITAVILAFVSACASPDSHSVLSAVQLLWVNLIMDTFAALALATDAPTEAILDRRPVPKSAPLITTNMWKMIIGQSIYQLVVTFVLYFAGAAILGYDLNQPVTDRSNDLQIQLDTIVFNVFVWMQIFNEFNNRRLDNRLNIFEGIHRNYFFIGINCVMIGGQVLIIFVGNIAFQITSLNSTQWAISILCALPCLVWAIVLRYIPDEYAATVFDMASNFWSSIYSPAAKAARSIYGPTFRALRRLSRRVLQRRGGAEHNQGDAEEQTSATSPISNPPPITLTTMD